MKVLFIAPKIGSQAKWLVGVAFLSAVLKKTGHQVELLEELLFFIWMNSHKNGVLALESVYS